MKPERPDDHAFMETITSAFDDVCGACGLLRNSPVHTDRVLPPLPDPLPHFDGATYDAELDYARLGNQLRAVLDVMVDGEWHTLRGLAVATGYPEASISARLRDLRKRKFGRWVVERERLDGGLWRYRLTGRKYDEAVDDER